MRKRYTYAAGVLAALSLFTAGCDELATGPEHQLLPSDDVVAIQTANVTYRYEGNPFNLFSCGGTSLCSVANPSFTSYSSADFVTAELTLTDALPGGLNLHNVRNLPGFSLTMTDGHQTLTLDPGVPGEALVSTDASGNIIGPWSLIINCCQFPNNGVHTLNYPGVRGIADGGTLSAATALFPTTPLDAARILGTPATWTTVLVSTDSDGDGVPNTADLCADTPTGASVGADGCTLQQRIEVVAAVAEQLTDLILAHPNTKLADKVEDALSKVQEALWKLAQAPPDGQGALGALEGAAGDLEAAVKDRVLDPAEGSAVLLDLVAAARLFAAEAIAQARSRGGDTQKVAEAEQALERGDTRRDSGRYKAAVAAYKDTIAKAEGA